MRRGALIAWVLMLAVALPAIAAASWTNPGKGSGYSKAQALSQGNVPTATASGRNVTVSWFATGGTVPVSGYAVRRYDTSGVAQTVGSGCSGTIAALTCTEQNVPGGQWRYSVTPLNGNWRGVESSQGTAVTVVSASMTLSPATVSSLPANLSGQITNFTAGQTVSFRLDNATTGTVLSGSISPTPVPSNGTSSVSVTVPAGTVNGAHTIYAIGSGGDVASAPVTVAVPVTTTISTSAWEGRDASAGTGAVNQNDTSAFAGDSRSAPSGAFATAFSTTRYVQYTFNDPLPSEGTVASTAFNFSFAGTVAGETTCFYFDVRKASTGAVVATHGSAAEPVSCTTGTTFKSTSTSLSAVTTAELAGDLQIRVYARNSGEDPLNVDLATVSGVHSGMSFTLFEKSYVDSASGTAAAASPWALHSADSVSYASAENWTTNFTTSRYLKLTFPSYVPTNATLNSVSLKHSYRAVTSGANVCYYLEIYSGAALIESYGSSSTPISCNSSSTVWKTDAVTLSKVTTPAAANALSVQLYVKSTAGKSRHDLAELTITYTK